MKLFPREWAMNRLAFKLGLTFVGMFCVGTAWGCTITNHSDVADGKGNTDYFETPDIYRGAVIGSGSRFENCAPLTSVRLRIQPSLSGLKYVRTLVRNGASTPLYEFHPPHPWFSSILISARPAVPCSSNCQWTMARPWRLMCPSASMGWLISA